LDWEIIDSHFGMKIYEVGLDWEIIDSHFGMKIYEVGLDCFGLCGFGLVNCLGLFDVSCLLFMLFMKSNYFLPSNFEDQNFRIKIAFLELYFLVA